MNKMGRSSGVLSRWDTITPSLLCAIWAATLNRSDDRKWRNMTANMKYQSLQNNNVHSLGSTCRIRSDQGLITLWKNPE